MRFTTKVEKGIEIGDERIITKFLLRPRKIGSEVRWLETANIKQRVCTWTAADEMGTMTVYGWRDIEWL